jgi:hypothetical protein
VNYVDEIYRAPGLVRDYAPFIFNRVAEFARLYHWLLIEEIGVEAVRLARIAEARFKPELGYDFSTFCEFYLKGLHRFAKRHPDYRPKPKQRPSAVCRVHPSVRQMLTLSRGDPDFARIVIGYRPATANGHADISVLHEVATRRRHRHAQELLEAIEAERPHCSENEAAILDWIEARLAGTDNRRAVEVAKTLGLTKGAVSKIQNRLTARLELQCERAKRTLRALLQPRKILA